MTPGLTASIAIATLLVVVALLIALLHQARERIIEYKTQVFDLGEQLDDVKQQLKPFEWRIKPDPVSPFAVRVRDRTDVPRRVTRPPGSVLDFTDISDIPDWEA